MGDLRQAAEMAEDLPSSMGTALRNALSRVEAGSKLDKKIRHHNAMVRQFGLGSGTMTNAPDGYHIDKNGIIRLGQGGQRFRPFAKAVKAKLKEKNT